MTKADTIKKTVAAMVVSARPQPISSDIGLRIIPKVNLSPLEKKRVMNATVNVNQAFLTDKNRPHLLSLERN